jgi:alanine racemase
MYYLKKPAQRWKQVLGYSFIKHIANSAAIFRKPEYQFDMVRLGIGLYGVDSADGNGLSLQTVTTLRSTIAQIRKVKAGDTVGYGRKGQVHRDSLVATVRIGYADGYGRELGNGKGRMFLQKTGACDRQCMYGYDDDRCNRYSRCKRRR